MQAQSLLGSARTIDARLDELLSANKLADAPIAWRHAMVVRAALGDVAEQLHAGTPVPTGPDPAPADRAFFALLDALSAGVDPTPEQVAESVDDGEQVVERLRATDRIEVRADALVVPLGHDPAGSNWWAVLEFLCDSMARLATKASRVHSRVVVGGADDSLVAVWDSVTERLDVLGDVLDEMTDHGRYAERSVGAGEGPSEFVTWAADQFRSEERTDEFSEEV